MTNEPGKNPHELPDPHHPHLFERGSWLETSRIAGVLRTEMTGGMLLIVAAIVAIIWANTPWSDLYDTARDYRPLEPLYDAITPFGQHFHVFELDIGHWAADGLLAIFFFVVGLELKREFVAGDLRDPRRAALPVAAAVGGMVMPALIYVAVNTSLAGGDLRGWAIPTATDIAFAVAVLAVLSTHLPAGLRTFLLTLAVVDDLLAITIIAVFYTEHLSLGFLLLSLVPIAIFGLLAQKRVRSAWLLVPLALFAWLFMLESGIHATIAGVLLGFTVPVLRSDRADGPGLAEHLEHLVRPISAGVAVPIFAFFAAGVTVGGLNDLTTALTQPIALGVILGLVLGKIIGIAGFTWLLSTFTHAELDDELSWLDVVGMASLAGIGFTVSLLIGDLAYRGGDERDDFVKIGVLCGSVIASAIAAVILRARNRVYKKIAEVEQRDLNLDGVPDVFEDDQGL